MEKPKFCKTRLFSAPKRQIPQLGSKCYELRKTAVSTNQSICWNPVIIIINQHIITGYFWIQNTETDVAMSQQQQCWLCRRQSSSASAEWASRHRRQVPSVAGSWRHASSEAQRRDVQWPAASCILGPAALPWPPIARRNPEPTLHSAVGSTPATK